MTERNTILRGILGTGGLGGCPRRRLGSAVPEYYTVLPQQKDLAIETHEEDSTSCIVTPLLSRRVLEYYRVFIVFYWFYKWSTFSVVSEYFICMLFCGIGRFCNSLGNLLKGSRHPSRLPSSSVIDWRNSGFTGPASGRSGVPPQSKAPSHPKQPSQEPF